MKSKILTNPFILNNFPILILLGISLLIGILSVWRMPIFSDSAFHASIIREINSSGYFPVYSPVGRASGFSTHPLSYEPFLTHPPHYYLLSANLVTSGISISLVLSILAIAPMVLTVFYFYKLIHLYFNRKIAFYSSLFLTFMPMSIWVTSHRLTESMQYFLSISAIYYSEKLIRTKEMKYIILTALFLCIALYIKVTSLFIVLSVIVYLVLRRINISYLVVFTLIVGALYAPYIYFSVQARGTISYAPPGFPILDKYVFNPWWKWNLSEEENKLAKISNQYALRTKVDEYDRTKRSFIQDDFQELNFINLSQKYNILPVSNKANAHWFSPNLIYISIYFILFVSGIVIYFIKYRENKIYLLVLPLFILTTYYLTKVAELRYFFLLNILFTVTYAIAIDELMKLLKNKYIKVIFLAILTFSLMSISVSELIHSYQFKSSLSHNLMPDNTGVNELEELSKLNIIPAGGKVFTFSNSEVSYYLDRSTVWDYRLLFIPEKEIDEYLDAYDVSIILLPNFLFKETIYSLNQGKETANLKKNWEGTSIPLDSTFYSYLQDGKKVKIIKKYSSFIVYERLKA